MVDGLGFVMGTHPSHPRKGEQEAGAGLLPGGLESHWLGLRRVDLLLEPSA